MTLIADLTVVRGGFTLAVALQVDRGEVVAVVGPNGAGKSTLLRAIAGLERIASGSIACRDEVWDRPPSTWVSPRSRRCGLLASEPLLFPHLDARDNVAFGPRAAGAGRDAARTTAQGWLERLGVAAVARRRPATLSTGEAQRVALARTLASAPSMLLLDEPLAPVDIQARHVLRRDLNEHLHDFAGPCLIVSHDPIDAAALADRMVVLEGGVVTQDGHVDEVARVPRSSWAAAMVGVNVYRGDARGGRTALANGGELVAADAPDGAVVVIVHPRAVALHLERPEGSPRNVWLAQVTDIQRIDEGVRVSLSGQPPIVAHVTPAAVADLALVPGRAVWASVKASEVRAVPE